MRRTSKYEKNVTDSQPSTSPNLCARLSQHPLTADITASLIISLDISCVFLYTEVIMFVTRECQTDSSHFTAEEMLDSWQQRHQLKQLFHTSCSCFWKPGSVNYNRHTLFTSALWQKRGGKRVPVRMFYQNWMTLLRFTQGDQGIPWLHPLSISSQNWLLWWWPTPKPLIRSLFSFRACKCEPSSSPLCAAKLAQSNAWPQIWSPQAFPYR